MYRVPDGWYEYSRCGEVIDGTGILASKTPLKKGFNKCKERPEGIPPAEEFTPTQLVDYCKKKGQTIGLVVDLTFTSRYYDPKEFESFGIQHAKIACPGHEIPNQDVYTKFAEVLKNYLALDDPGLIIVHCTHGVNRTGYLVCKFLIDHFKYTADDAIKAFNTVRGHSIERKNYTNDLQDYWQYIQDRSRSTKKAGKDIKKSPAKQPHKKHWEAKPWVGKQSYGNRTFYNDPSWYSGYRHPQWYCDTYDSYQHHHQYSEPNGYYTRSRGRRDFHHGTFRQHRGRPTPHPRERNERYTTPDWYQPPITRSSGKHKKY